MIAIIVGNQKLHDNLISILNKLGYKWCWQNTNYIQHQVDIKEFPVIICDNNQLDGYTLDYFLRCTSLCKYIIDLR